MDDGGRLQAWLALPPADRPSDELLRIDPLALDAVGRVDFVTLLDQHERLTQAAKVRVLAEIDRRDDTKLGLSQEEVSLALRVPPGEATMNLKTARTLVDRLPLTLAGLAAGQFSARHAATLAERTWRLEPETIPVFEEAGLGKAPYKTLSEFKRFLTREEIRLEPAKAEARHQAALAERKVGFQALDDGMAGLPVVLSAPDAQSVFTRLTAAAKLLPANDPRTMDQRRADLLVDAVLSGIPAGALPEMQGRRPSVQVTVSADTLLNLDDEPGDLSGYGPVTAETARRMAADESGTWRRLLTDPNTGDLLDISADTYRPSQRLRDFIGARDGVCVFPGCNQPAYRCEYEHTIPFDQGGRTTRSNGAPACKRHNLIKINTGWGYTHNPDHSITPTTPSPGPPPPGTPTPRIHRPAGPNPTNHHHQIRLGPRPSNGRRKKTPTTPTSPCTGAPNSALPAPGTTTPARTTPAEHWPKHGHKDNANSPTAKTTTSPRSDHEKRLRASGTVNEHRPPDTTAPAGKPRRADKAPGLSSRTGRSQPRRAARRLAPSGRRKLR